MHFTNATDALDPPGSAIAPPLPDCWNERSDIPALFSPDIDRDALNVVAGLRQYETDDVPFVLPGEAAPEWPCLRLRPSTVGAGGVWWIEDRLDGRARKALGMESDRFRRSTQAAESNRFAAAQAFVDYTDMKRLRLLGAIVPGDIPVLPVLAVYQDHLQSGAHNLVAGTIRTYLLKLSHVAPYFARMRLGGITPKRCKLYEVHRLRESGTRATRTEIRHELATLRQAVNHFMESTGVKLHVGYYMPERDTPPVQWLTRDEVARYLRACRGWIAVELRDEAGRVIGHRWKVARDLDPSLAGPEGDRRVLRPAGEIEARRMEARRVLLGIYTGSRHNVLIGTAYKQESEAAHVSFLSGTVERKPLGAADTNKRRPRIPVVPKIERLVFNCAWRDAQPRPGKRCPTHFLHKADGTPFATGGPSLNLRKAILKDAGVDKPINSHILRHTTAMWLKIEGVSIQVAANFLGCSTEVLEKHYADWDMTSLFSAIDALTGGRRQKSGLKRARALGLSPMGVADA